MGTVQQLADGAERAPAMPSKLAVNKAADSEIDKATLVPPVTRPEDAKVLVLVKKEDLPQILAEAGKRLVLIEFFADWCGPCRLLAMKLDEWAKTYYDRCVIIKINVDDFEEVALEYDVSTMPTMLFVRKKVKVGEEIGGNADKILQTIEQLLREPIGVRTGLPQIKKEPRPST